MKTLFQKLLGHLIAQLACVSLALLTLAIPPHELFLPFFSSTHYMKMERTSSSLQPRHSEIPIKAVSILYQPKRKRRIKLVHFLLIQGMILSVYLLFFFFKPKPQACNYWHAWIDNVVNHKATALILLGELYVGHSCCCCYYFTVMKYYF